MIVPGLEVSFVTLEMSDRQVVGSVRMSLVSGFPGGDTRSTLTYQFVYLIDLQKKKKEKEEI